MNDPSRYSRLVDELATLLRNGQQGRYFLFIENELPQTKSLHTTVIWNKWPEGDMQARSRVILDAYQRSKRKENMNITVALGLKAREAVAAGLLPYRIEITRRKGDDIRPKDLAKAMLQAGDGVFIKEGSHLELRFPTMERADRVYRKLLENVPGPYWKLVQEVSMVA